MIIKTKEFSFPKAEYLKILVNNSLRRNMWSVVFMILIAGYAIFQGTGGYAMFKGTQGWVNILLAALPVVFFSYLVFRCWIHVNSKKNDAFFKDRFFEIDDKTLSARFPDGSSTKIIIDDILRVVKKSGFYQLFLSKKSFIYIPLSAFKTNGDIEKFDFY